MFPYATSRSFSPTMKKSPSSTTVLVLSYLFWFTHNRRIIYFIGKDEVLLAIISRVTEFDEFFMFRMKSSDFLMLSTF